MADYNDRLKDYVQVNERVIAFYKEFPTGSLQSEIVRFDDKIVIVKAWAYRSPDDLKPGIGHSYLALPGTTNFTRGSELENAETSAWGRALASLGFEVKRGIASQHEIDMKRTEPPPPALGPQNTGQYVGRPQIEVLMRSAIAKMGKGNGTFQIAMWTKELGCTSETTTVDQLGELMKRVAEWRPDEQPPREPGDEPLSTDLDAALGKVEETMDRVGQQSNDGTKISVAQGKRLYAIAKGNKQLLKDTLAQFGFEHDRDIPKGAHYDAICKALEAAQVGDAPQDSPDIEW